MDLDCRVSGKEIVITSPGSARLPFPHRIEGEPRLKTKAPPTGPTEFKVQAWRLANDKARELAGLCESINGASASGRSPFLRKKPGCGGRKPDSRIILLEWATRTCLAIGKSQRAFMADPETKFAVSGVAGRGGCAAARIAGSASSRPPQLLRCHIDQKRSNKLIESSSLALSSGFAFKG